MAHDRGLPGGQLQNCVTTVGAPDILLAIAQMQQCVIIVEPQGILLLHVQWSLYAATVRSQDTSRMSVEASQSAIPAENPDILPKVVQCRKEGFLKRGYAITVIDQDILLWIVPTRRRATIVARLDIWQGIASIVPCAMAAANRVTLYEIVL